MIIKLITTHGPDNSVSDTRRKGLRLKWEFGIPTFACVSHGNGKYITWCSSGSEIGIFFTQEWDRVRIKSHSRRPLQYGVMT